MTATLRLATTDDDFRSMGSLIAEYVVWQRERYADQDWLLREVHDEQSLDAELQALPSRYGPPAGRALLVEVDGEVRGAGAWRRLDEHTCEMKRVFVPTRFQGQGLGRVLCQGLLDSAREAGYREIKLDTGLRMTEAAALYRAMGFRPCAPYHDYPARLLPHIGFMSLSLVEA